MSGRGKGQGGGGGGRGRGRGGGGPPPQQPRDNPRGAGGDHVRPQQQQQRRDTGGAWGGGDQGPWRQGGDGRQQLPQGQQFPAMARAAHAQPTPGGGDDGWQNVSRRTPQHGPREQQQGAQQQRTAWVQPQPQQIAPGSQQQPIAWGRARPPMQQVVQGPGQQQQPTAWGRARPPMQQVVQGPMQQQQHRPSPPAWGQPQAQQNIPTVAQSSRSTAATVEFVGTDQQSSMQVERQQQLPPVARAPVEGACAMGSLSLEDRPSPPPSGAGMDGNWLYLPDNREDIRLPVRNGMGTAGTRIKIRVNHFPLTINLPKRIFVYEAVVERQRAPAPGGQGAQAVLPTRLPKRVLQKILKCFAMKLGRDWNIGIISDMSRNIYSTVKIEDVRVRGRQCGLIHEVDMSQFQGANDPDPEELETGTFNIRLEPTPLEIDLPSLANDINNMRGINNPKLLKDLALIYNALIKCMPNYRYLALGRSLLIRLPPAGQDGFPLTGGLKCWPGISACINPGWKYYMELGLGYSTMIIGARVITALEEHFRDNCTDVRQWSREDIQSATKFLERCKVRYEPQAGMVRQGTVQRVHECPPSVATFPINNHNVTVENYFRDTYGTTLQYPNGPLLVFTGRGNLIPAELCTIKSGQSVNRKLNDNQTREMVSIARKKPHELERSLLDAASRLQLNNNRLFQQFGVRFGDQMLELDCRVLDPPVITYKSPARDAGLDVTPRDGVWMVWQHNFQFQRSSTGAGNANKRPWGICVIGGDRDLENIDDRACMNFSRAFVDLSRHCGLAFQDRPIVRRQRMRDYPREHFDNVRALNGIFQDLKEKQCVVVIVVLPKKPSPFYAQVKQAAELSSNRVGILTQCILAQNFKPKPPKRMDNRSSTVQQLLLKVNSKLNGVNHYVTIPPPLTSNFDRINVSKEPIMFLGADVTHPPPGTSVRDPNNPREQISPPSFAAVTASIDPTAMPYMMHVQAQRKEQRGAAEVVQGLDDIVAEFLKVFLGKNTILPTKIIYFRDGVGDGQFTELLDVEMRAIRNACMRFDAANHGKPYQPKITFITVQKRHKTRFFFKTDRGTDNAPPGTVVDTEIVHPTETDFFLLSHQAIQGTSRPTRYHLLWDDSDFTQDEIQTLTYYMCHMYVRCNRSVKIPAPTYYAHWAAARAKCLAEGQPIDLDLVSLNNIIQREANFKNAFPMHFI